MPHTYRRRIEQFYENLSPSYTRTADYILRHYLEVAFMTAAELADKVGTDTTTIVRFAQRLEYPGYPHLLDDIRAHVREEISGQLGYGKAAYEDALKAWIDYDAAQRNFLANPGDSSLAESVSLTYTVASRITAALVQ